MAGIDLRKTCLNALAQVSGDVEDALVYLDAGAGEALHFIGGLAAFLPFNPRAVCSLEHASPLDAAAHWNMTCKGPVQKLLVVTACLLSDAHRHILRCLRLHKSLNLCTIWTSISEDAHSQHPDTPLGPDAFHVYKRLLLEDFQSLLQRAKFGTFLTTNDAKDDRHSMDLNTHYREEHFKASSQFSDDKNADEVVKPGDDLCMGLMIEVKHFPMIFCPLTTNTFVFPSNGLLAEAPLSNKLDKGLSLGLPGIDVGMAMRDEDNIPIGGTLLAHFLRHLAVQLDLKMDVFTLGPLSHEVGKLVTEFSGLSDVSGRAKRSAGLLLIDRTLDLITPSCHGDSLVDRFFSSLPRRNMDSGIQKLNSGAEFAAIRRRPLDVRVPETAGVSNAGDSQKEIPENKKIDIGNNTLNKMLAKLCAMGGSLFDSIESGETACIDLLFDKRTKECLISIKKWLQEALRREKMNLFKRGRLGAVTAEEIRVLRKQLSQNLSSSLRHADLIQIATSVEIVLGPIFGPKWEALSSAEKILMLSVGDSSQSVAFQIRDLVHQSVHAEKSRKCGSDHSHGLGLISLRDALTLAIVGYGLAGDSFGSSVSGGPFSWEEERELKEAVVDAILHGCWENVGFLSGLEDAIVAHYKGQDLGRKAEGVNLASLRHDVERENSGQDAEANPEDGWETWEDDPDQDALETVENNASVQGYVEMQFQLELQDRVEEVFKQLRRVSEARKYLSIKEKPLLLEDKSTFGGSSRTQRSLLYRILSLIFMGSDIPGLQHHSSAVGRFLKSGLGRFGLGQVKSKLNDFKIILVFIVGGINGVEVNSELIQMGTAQEQSPVCIAIRFFNILPNDISSCFSEDLESQSPGEILSTACNEKLITDLNEMSSKDGLQTRWLL